MLAYGKPLKEGPLDLETEVRYPVLVTPKLDGIRALKINGKLVSRKFKRIPNLYIRSKLAEANLPDNVDGELITFTDGKMDKYNDVQSKVMTEEGEPTFIYYIFDYVTHKSEPACNRAMLLISSTFTAPHVLPLIPTWCHDAQRLAELEAHHLLLGFEGLMLRDPNSPYKCGRSTKREGYLTKLKRFEDGEAMVINFIEEQHNLNVATLDAQGYTERSSHAENKIGAGRLGTMFVRDLNTAQEFYLSAGAMTHAQKSEVWRNQKFYTGKTAKFRYQAHGTKDSPRIPIFVGWRDLTID